MHKVLGAWLAVAVALLGISGCRTVETVGDGLASTSQRIRPAGRQIEFSGRPIDLALSRDAALLYVKDDRGLVILDTSALTIVQELRCPSGSSLHGLVTAPDDSVWFTDAKSGLLQARATNGSFRWVQQIALPKPQNGGEAYPCGLALSKDGATAWVALSRNNALAVVDLRQGNVRQLIPTGIAPYAVAVSADETRAFITCWGGRKPSSGARTQKSSETEVAVDERGVANAATVSFVDLKAAREVGDVEVGLQPSQLVVHPNGTRLYVANANADTVSVIDLSDRLKPGLQADSRRVIESISTKPDPDLPFGSAPNALAMSPDGQRLYVANGGNNAIAIVRLGERSTLEGFVPTGWYPGALCLRGNTLYIANVKGVGSRLKLRRRKGWSVADFKGTISVVELPAQRDLHHFTGQVLADSRVPEALRAFQQSARNERSVPLPRRLGEASVFEHVVYIIKENRTYDQVFGDLPQGRGDPTLTIFGREVTPNHHALAEQFVLLDNYYCNGVVSADGHAWSTEAYASSYLEKAFGGWTRSYPWGDDPLSVASSGFIWDNVLGHGLSFWNWGEMDYAETIPPKASSRDLYDQYRQGVAAIPFEQNISIDRLRQFSSRKYPGWNLRIPDVWRAQVFGEELRQWEKKGHWPNLSIIFLGNDHTSGTTPGWHTPRAQVADNDLALGKIIEAITHSRFWPKTCIFVIEDDPQDGFDHVDGHRSLCLVISPYTKRGKVISKFYNQTAVVHTMQRILGLPPMNQMDALSPLMFEVFQTKPNFAPYVALKNQVPLDELNPPLETLSEQQQFWARKSLQQQFDQYDAADEDTLNRILWHSVKGAHAPYPEHLAGAHARGLIPTRRD